MFKKLLLVTCAVTLLAACEADDPKNVTDKYKLPPELAHCQIYRVDNGGGAMRVVVCPNSTTSTQYTSGKTTQNNSVYFEGETL